MTTIMVATDFSERSDRALRRATLLARQVGAKLELVHVVDDDKPPRLIESERRIAETLLRETAGSIQDVEQLDCDTHVLTAPPFAGIIQAVETFAPDLLVIGPHRRSILRDAFRGTTAERTIRSISCPTLMANATPAGRYQHIMLTTDLSQAAGKAVKRYLDLGIGDQARHSILHVYDAPALRLGMSHSLPKDEKEHYLEEASEAAEQDLATFLATIGRGGMKQLVRFLETSVANEILLASREAGADLIMVANHGKSGTEKFFLGSVTEQVLKISNLDVITMPVSNNAYKN